MNLACHPFLRLGLDFLVIVALLGLSDVTVLAERVPVGYALTGQSVEFLHRDDLLTTLQERFPNDVTISVRAGNRIAETSLPALGIEHNYQQILTAVFPDVSPVKRLTTDWQRLWSPALLELSLQVNEPIFAAELERLAEALTQAPTDASVNFDATESVFLAVPAQLGQAVTVDLLRQQFLEQLASGTRLVYVRSPKIEPTITTLKAEAAAAQANVWLTTHLAVDLLGIVKEIPRSLVQSGIVFVAQGETLTARFDPNLMESGVHEFVKEIDQSKTVIIESTLVTQIIEAVQAGSGTITAASLPRPVKKQTSTSTQPTTHASSSVKSTGSYQTPSGTHDPGGPGNAVSYTIYVEQGLAVTPDEFASVVAEVLDDGRSWRGSAAVYFVRVESGGFPLYLVSPSTVNRLCAPLDTNSFTSCAIGNRVVINYDRFTQGSPYFPGTLTEYRTMVINHEVGHHLGQRHHVCPGSGLAPVMHQQTLGMKGCEVNPWPLDWELDRIR